MKITKIRIKKLKPCREGWEWYLKNQETDLEKLLININETHPDWARWLFTNLMNKKQNVAIAIFSANLVINLYEKEYPTDKRPREAINAALDYLKRPSEKTKSAARSAAQYAARAAVRSAAWAAQYAARSAQYAARSAARSAQYAARSAQYAARAAQYAARSAARSAAWAAVRKELQIKIIKETIRILEEK